MEPTIFVTDEFDVESFKISKPKKYKNGEMMISKIKNKNNEPVLVQFPKMNLLKFEKSAELEFTSEKGYSKKVIDYINKLDTFLTEYISTHSEDWFGKIIPTESVSKMYTKCIKTENALGSVLFVFDKTKSQLIDKNNENLEISELESGVTVECISQIKYIVFTKETCFVNWEICTAKLHKKVNVVPKFGFIEETTDSESESEILTFY